MKNMKKRGLCLCAAAVLLGICGCGRETELPVTLAVVTDGGSTEDQAVNQAVWQTVQAYGEETGEETGCYVPEDKSASACRDAIDEAVKKGAEVVVCHGEEAGAAVYEAQREYRDVRFLLLDAEPHAGGSDRARLRGNTRCILFDREEAGFLAGYAAVREGYTSLAYYGGADGDRAKEYGAGFLEGAQEAASEMQLEEGGVQIRYEERGTDGVSPEFMNETEQLYREGCQAIFTDGSAFETIVRKAAELTGGNVLGVVTDESQKSANVVISAANKYEEILKQELQDVAGESFDGGKTETAGIREGGVGLTMDTSRLQNFTEDQYQEIIGKIEEGQIQFRGTEVLEHTDDLQLLQLQTDG